MADRVAHLEQARANLEIGEDFLKRAEASGNPVHVQWAIIAAFYCSVHCVEAHLNQYSIHSGNHENRRANMDAAQVPDDIYNSHMMLKDLSEQARYELAHFTVEFARRTVYGRHLSRIRRWAGLENGA